MVTKGCMVHGADLVGTQGVPVDRDGACPPAHRSPEGAEHHPRLRSRATFQDAELTMHVIVHGIWDPEVREQSLEAIEKVFRKYGLTYEVVKDFYETEKGMAHHGG
jgi:hypothetical protein